MDQTKIVIAGAMPDRQNRNATLRGYVAEGFGDIFGIESVANVALEYADERVRSAKPLLTLAFGSCLLDQCEYSALRRACDVVGCPLVFWLHDDPYEFDASAKITGIADYIFTNDRWAAEHYHRDSVLHLPLAASPTNHRPRYSLFAPEKVRDVFFCGVLYENRKRIIMDLSEKLRHLETQIFTGGWAPLELPFCLNERIANEHIADYYATSHVVLNLGRDYNYANKKYQLNASTPGPRTFEAAMAGACQLMFADSLEVLDYFDLGKEIMLFDDPKSFERAVDEVLAQPERGIQIGAAAQARCLADHTYSARARTMLSAIGMKVSEREETPCFDAVA